MLKRDHLIGASDIAQQFALKGLCVRPMPNTPLMQLAGCSVTERDVQNFISDRKLDNGVLCDHGGDTVGISDVTMLTDRTNAPMLPGGQVSMHDMAQETIVQREAAIITNNVMLARNVINPMIIDVVEGIESHLNEIPSVALPLDIQVCKWAPIWDSANLRTAVGPFVRTLPKAITVKLATFPKLSIEELRGYVTSGASGLDQEVNEWLNSTGEQFLLAVYENLFVFDKSPSEAMSWILSTRQTYNSHDVCLAICVLVSAFLRKLPDGINATNQNVEYAMNDMAGYAATEIEQAMKIRDFNREKSILVLGYPVYSSASAGAKTVITVNGDLYDTWLEQGGKPAVLLGAAFCDKPVRIDVINEGFARYVATWQNKNAEKQAMIKDSRLANVRAELKRQLFKRIPEISDEHRIGVTVESMRASVDQAVRNLFISDIENMGLLVRRVVCQCFFPNTEALVILEAMDSILKIDPSLNPNDAASIAILRFITDHVCKQMFIGSIQTS